MVKSISQRADLMKKVVFLINVTDKLETSGYTCPPNSRKVAEKLWGYFARTNKPLSPKTFLRIVKQNNKCR
jgi:hypothetical protein